jgi:hypothetical protein
VIDAYERIPELKIKSAFLKSESVFKVRPQLIANNLNGELIKQSYIRSLINKPTAPKKMKPSKASTKTATEKRGQNVNPIPLRIDIIPELEGSVYYVKSIHKVSTPKGLPSEVAELRLMQEDSDSKSTGSKDNQKSLMDSKSETSSIKSFFKSTFEKLQLQFMNRTSNSQNSADKDD